MKIKLKTKLIYAFIIYTCIYLFYIFPYDYYLFYVLNVGLGGCGFNAPPFIFVSYYFSRYSSLAVGLASLGSAVGPMAFAPLSRYLIDEYGWRGAMLITSGILLNGCVCGALMCPAESWVTKVNTKPQDLRESNGVTENVVTEIGKEGKKQSTIANLFDLDLLGTCKQWVLNPEPTRANNGSVYMVDVSS